MSSSSDIEWTDATWNPVVGCTRVGGDDSGCAHCYAEGQAPRIEAKLDRPTTIKLAGKSKRPGLTFTPKDANGESLGLGARWTGTVWMLPDVLATPLRWRAPKRVFVNSMSDLFHENLVDSEEGRRFIAAVFGVMAATPRHTYQVLTKRPEKAREWVAWLDEQSAAKVDRGTSPTLDHARQSIAWECARQHVDAKRLGELRLAQERAWPLPNVWLGVSAEHQRAADERVPVLLDLPAAVRFVSYEPALGPVDWSEWIAAPIEKREQAHHMRTGHWCERDDACDLCPNWRGDTMIDWIIAGGESGPKSRAPSLDWMRSTRAQCKQAGVAFFFKQWGEWAPASQLPDDEWSRLDACGKFSDEELAGDEPIRVGKGRAGRLLDGRTHDEFPEVR